MNMCDCKMSDMPARVGTAGKRHPIPTKCAICRAKWRRSSQNGRCFDVIIRTSTFVPHTGRTGLESDLLWAAAHSKTSSCQ